MELDTQVLVEFAIILLAIGLGSFVKGVTGTGLPQVAIPTMALFLGVERAVVIMAIPGVVTNAWLLWRLRSSLRLTRDLPVLIGGGVVGAIVGTVGLDRLDGAVLALVLAGMVVVYLAIHASPLDLRIEPSVSRWTAAPLGVVAGAMQGATGISAPLLATYLHAYRLPKQVYVVSLVTLFQVYSVVQVIALARVGLYSAPRVIESVLALIPMMLIMPLGVRYAARLSERVFDRWVVGLLVVTALALVYDGLRTLLA